MFRSTIKRAISIVAMSACLALPAACHSRSRPRPAVEPIVDIREAAEAGNPAAQYELGKMYREGRDAASDPVTAYVWFHLAAIGGHGPAGKSRDELAETLTPEQIEEARHLVEKWGFIQFMEQFE